MGSHLGNAGGHPGVLDKARLRTRGALDDSPRQTESTLFASENGHSLRQMESTLFASENCIVTAGWEPGAFVKPPV